jgi:hypothetical protein
MHEWAWGALKVLAFLLVFVALSSVWEKMRNTVSARFGIGGFYNRLTGRRRREGFRSKDASRVISDIEGLGDYLLNRAMEHRRPHDSPVDWEWRLGGDLQEVASLARIARSDLQSHVVMNPPP